MNIVYFKLEILQLCAALNLLDDDVTIARQSFDWTCVKLAKVCACQHLENYCDSVISLGDEVEVRIALIILVDAELRLFANDSCNFSSKTLENYRSRAGIFSVDRSVTCFLLLSRGRKSKNMWFFPSQRSMNERRKKLWASYDYKQQTHVVRVGIFMLTELIRLFSCSLIFIFIHESAEFSRLFLSKSFECLHRDAFPVGWAAVEFLIASQSIPPPSPSLNQNASLPKSKQNNLT